MKKECISMVCTLLALVIISPVCHALTGIRTDRKIIVIDPGHGGYETGGEDASGIMEKDLDLELALALAEILNENFTAILTRTDDTYQGIRERTALANNRKADLFISLHAKPGTFRQKAPTCYFYQPAGGLPPAAAGSTAKWDLNQIPHLPQSQRAASLICSALDKVPDSGTCISLGAPLAVLSGAGMPALLVEPLALPDAAQAPEASKALIRTIAERLAGGIAAFFKTP